MSCLRECRFRVVFNFHPNTNNRPPFPQGNFLAGALRNYGKGLAASREPDLRAVFAIVSLWFNNQADPAVNKEMEEITRTVCLSCGMSICAHVHMNRSVYLSTCLCDYLRV